MVLVIPLEELRASQLASTMLHAKRVFKFSFQTVMKLSRNATRKNTGGKSGIT